MRVVLFAATSLFFSFARVSVGQPPLINTQHRLFADDLTKELYNSSKENEFTSTWGISLAFGLLYPAAIDDSYSQMQSVLRFPDIGNAEGNSALVWDETATRLDQRYDGA